MEVLGLGACALRRRKVLDNMRAQELLGLQIPQCDDDNDHFYRKKQCLAGTTKCWCVSNFGRKLIGANDDCEVARRRQENLLVKAQNLLKESTAFEKNTTKCYGIRAGICPKTPEFSRMNSQFSGGVPCRCDSDCYDNNKCCPGLGRTNNLAESETQRFCMKPVTPSGLSMVCGANEQFSACYSPCQPFCEDPTVTACPPPACQPGCHCQPGYIRRDGSPKSACVPRQTCETYDLSARCADPRRQYHSCGSACPISCDNRNQPRCGEHCVAGCFCKLPYILLDDENPLTSRCILPAECPASQTQAPSIHYLARHPVQMPVFPSIPQYPYTGVSPNQNIHYGASCTPNELLNCTSKECGPPRCYCRLPYILSDGKDPDSACVLPQLCPRFKEESSFIPETTAKTPSKTLEKKCNDPKKMWTSCGAQGCARSCVNPLGRCSEGQCYEGCICKEPYVIQDPKDPESPCLLPSECENHCDDPLKEFVKCASSCPMGCDNRHPKHCTPCEDGCFCKNGLVFINSTDWKTSECVRLDECPTEQEKSSEKAEPEFKFKLPSGSSEMPAVKTSTFLKMDSNETKDETDSIAKFTAKQLPRPTKCPATTYDVGGRPCVDDSDCPVEQLCCKPKIMHVSRSKRHLEALWDVVSGILWTAFASHDEAQFSKATIKELPPKDPFQDRQIAAAVLVSPDSSVTGRFTFSEITSSTTKIEG
ncbi:hypothetical protein WR25_16653 [Diploscapter pachys]|uniref:Thyroglobulin type-1 domain-containing protein n=1 Tax=Diploscapter pachys TaxID=2018661 RepID=A0A2A2KDL2_9BILA|nr:hypothetical protein WR25_16653 [Diploscapter pachys]